MSVSETKPGRCARAGAKVALAILLSASLAGCVPWELSQILDGPQGKALAISPSATVLQAGGTLSFAASGGVPPYTYALVSGGGSVDPVTGLYAAPVSAGTAVVRVTDKTGKSKDATIIIQAYGALAISPSAVSVVAGNSVTFTPIGGVPPYTFSMQTSGSGSPSVASPSGAYTAGASPGTDVVKLTDSSAGTVSATITVTAVASTVDYMISGTSLPASGTVATAVPGGATFTLQNIGSGNGSQTVSWEMYLSLDSALGGGDMLVGSGTTGALPTGASAPVTVTGTFPLVTPGPWYLIVRVSAADDTTPANNTSGASAITLAAQNIDYSIPAVTNTGATVAGAALNGQLTIHNGGTALGVAAVDWAIYVSADTTIDASDYLVARGTNAPLAGGATTGALPFSGYWPSTPGTWYLLATVSAADDVSAANNTTASGTVTTTGPAPANVDYTVVSVLNTGGTTAGDPLAGTFTVNNGGTDPGTQPVSWTAYRSLDTTLQIGTDPVIDSGSTTALGAGATSGSIPFGGTWPSVPGPWHLIVAVSSSEDTVPTNNATASGLLTTTAPNVDYTVQSVSSTGGTTAGAALTGSLTIRNAGSHAGSQFVPWLVYLSSDAVLNVGTDQLVATGSIAAPGLAAGASSSALPLASTWPSSVTPKTWYLIAAVGAGDDVNSANDVVASTPVVVNPPNIDYTVTVVNNTGGTTAGGPISGNFTIQNVGSVGGGPSVTWTAYLSADTTIDISDTTLGTSSIGPLGAGGTNGPIGFSGTWPTGAATWYLIVKVSASDDINPANDATASLAVPVTDPPPPNYAVSFNAAIPWSGLVSTLMSATGGTPQITISNLTGNTGHATINWAVYLSTDNVLDGTDTLLASGGNAPLGALGSVPKSFDTMWPAAPGRYYWFIARVSAADDSSPADDVVVSHPVATGDYRYQEGAEPNNGNPPPSPPNPSSDTLVTAMVANKTIVIEGVMDAYNAYDTYKFISTATMSVGMQARWATGFDDLDLYLWDSVGSALNSPETGPNAEPSYGTYDTTSVSARTWYVSAWFYLAGNTSGSTGQKYLILVKGMP